MAHKEQTHYGDEDPEFEEPNEEDLFETAKYLGWQPEDLVDPEFAARYKEWLAKQPK